MTSWRAPTLLALLCHCDGEAVAVEAPGVSWRLKREALTVSWAQAPGRMCRFRTGPSPIFGVREAVDANYKRY